MSRLPAASIRPGTFRSLHPDASGAFSSEAERVAYHSPPLKAPPPAYWLSFSNEKSVIYGMGQTKSGFDYRVVEAGSNAPLDRATGCWVIRSGEFVYPPEGKGHSVILKVAIDRNPAATKPCAETPAPVQ